MLFPTHKLIRILLAAGAVALCTGTALAVDSVPCQATVSAASSELLEEAGEADTASVSLEQGDTLVLLDLEESDGWYSAAYEEDDDTVVTGYIQSEDVSVQTLGRVSILTDDASLLASADSDSDIVTSLGQGASLQVYGYTDGWFLVSAKGEVGYVPLSDVSCDVVTTSKLKLRSEPGTDGDVLEVLSKDITLTPLDAEGDWYLVSYDGQEGYVSSEYVTPVDADSYTVEDPSVTAGEEVLAYAQQFLGNRYVWGGTSLTKGCDCSGYVMQIYAHFGVSLPHSSSAIRNYGTKVSYSDIQVGDVVCYSGHVGIYAGNGKIINALNSRKGICYTSVNFASIVTIRRML